MLNTLSARLYCIASWKTLLLGIVLYIPFPAYFLKNLEAQLNTFAGKEIGPIDLLFGYKPTKIGQMVATYGAEGRAIYVQGTLIIDTAYPLVYTFLFCILLSLLFENRSYAPFRMVNVLPLSILVFDLIENGFIVYLLKSYPVSVASAAAFCSVLTNLKWAATVIVLGLAVYGLVRLAIGHRQRQVAQVEH